MRRLAAAVLVLAALPAAAQERLQADLAADVPITVGAAALWILTPDRSVPSPFDPGPAPGGLDGLAPTRTSSAAATASDVLVQVATWSSFLAAGIDGAADGDVGGRLLLQAEAVAVTGAITSIVKVAAGRPRPYTHGAGRVVEPDDHSSFFSGHTATAAAASFAAARALDLTGDLGTGTRVALYGGAGVITAAVGVLRIAAGRHFPTDVIAGAIVGGGVAFLVPELHRVAPGVGVGGGTKGMSLSFVF